MLQRRAAVLALVDEELVPVDGEAADLAAVQARAVLDEEVPRLRTTGVNTNGAAAKVMVFDRLGKKVLPGTFGKIKLG